MSKYTVDLTHAELDSIREALVIDANPNFTAEVWGDPEAAILTVALNEAAVEQLEQLPECFDWTCSDGQLYTGDAVYPLTVVHNA